MTREALWVVASALSVRLAAAVFGARYFPPADDGTFYHTVASRIAGGLGYTWLWPDGSVTYAAHYPVGYPAILGVAYAMFGSYVGVAMVVNALFGALGAFAAQVLAARAAGARAGLVAGLFVAFEPALVLYTPALMTESLAGALLVAGAALAAGRRPQRMPLRAAVTGGVLGVAVLVRPELLLLAPVVGVLAASSESWPRRAVASLVALGTALAVCAPWTIRNCARLERCALVSVNGGWNLYIGSSPLGRGGWVSLDAIGVPVECRTVFGEADKDACFGRAALGVIRDDPLGWLALVPSKLGATFDYGTAAAHYLSTSNPAVAGGGVKTAVGAMELVGQRLLLIAALFAVARSPGPRAKPRRLIAAAAALGALLPSAWVSWLGLVAATGLFGRQLFARPVLLLGASAVFVTACVHAVFFGASRYTLVCLPALAALGGTAFGRFDREGEVRG